MNLTQIKQAVLDGHTVCWQSLAYTVIVDCNGNWRIKSSYNSHAIALTWRDGVTMNGKEADFYIQPRPWCLSTKEN